MAMIKRSSPHLSNTQVSRRIMKCSRCGAALAKVIAEAIKKAAIEKMESETDLCDDCLNNASAPDR